MCKALFIEYGEITESSLSYGEATSVAVGLEIEPDR